jgi:RNA polymerase sigma-70 factor, ECF subfamily
MLTESGGHMDLTQLAAAARDGDGPAQDQLLAAARPLMLRWAARLVDDPALVQDVVQDALVEVHRTLGTLREPTAISGWLHLAVRKHADRHRRGRRSALLLDLNLALPANEVSGVVPGDPAAEAERAEDRVAVRRALALATDSDRLLLVLRYYGGWPESDLAALLGIGAGAVRKRLHDARRRLSNRLGPGCPAVVSPTPLANPWEKLVIDVRNLLGAMYDLDDSLPALPSGIPPLARPARPGRLPTGIKVLDTLVPLPRGGVVDMTGPVGTGHLALLAEILHNLAASGPAALVAVSSAQRPAPGASARLWKLLDAEAPAAESTAVITAPAGRETEAVVLAGRLAAWLAQTDTTVLLVADETVAGRAGPGLLGTAVGSSSSGPGSVTGVRLAPHAAGAAAVAAWPDADAELRTGSAEMITGFLPAVDVLASRSAVLDSGVLPAEDVATARRARELLARAAEVRGYLAQPLRIAERATGVTGHAVPVQDAVAGLEMLLDGMTPR